METIKNYLEAMFANMPNTPEVKKAKAELFAMMEDKYNELISDGVNENAAVGTVISEFGNLDELAEDLGLVDEVEEVHVKEKEVVRRAVTMAEVQDYFDDERKSGIIVGIGVLLCINSVIFPIIAEFVNVSDFYGVLGFFACIIVAVGLFVYNGTAKKDWDFLKKEPCQVDKATANLASEKKKDFRLTSAWMSTVGVLLCAFCWMPCAMFDKSDIVPVTLFICVGVGVFLFIYSANIQGSYETILNLNDNKTISGSYGKEDDVVYINESATVFMEVYWTTITCVYLAISFLTFSWGSTWVIWPVAAIVHKILSTTLAKED